MSHLDSWSDLTIAEEKGGLVRAWYAEGHWGKNFKSWGRPMTYNFFPNGAIVTYVGYLTILFTNVQMGTIFVSCWRR